MPFQRINVHADHTLYFRHPGVRKNTPMAIGTGANSIQWSYTLNTAQQPTFGGAVIQVLSTSADAMTISGQTKSNNQLRDIYEWFKEYGQIAGLSHREEHGVLFQYPERDWGFYIQPTTMPGFKYGVDKITVEWSIVAEIVADSAGDLNKATMSPFQGETKLFDPSLFNVGFISRDPRSDPNGDPAALDAAANYADNFQGLLGAYASGDFAHWAFDVLARPEDNKINPDSKSFWTSFLGSDYVAGGSGNTSSGSSVYAGGEPTTRDQVVSAIASTFEDKGVPGKLGVAVAYDESGLRPDARQNPGTGIGLFQVSDPGRVNTPAVTQARNHPTESVTKYYPALTQIRDAANYFKTYQNSDLGTWAANAQQGARGGNPPSADQWDAYKRKIEALLDDAAGWIRSAERAAGGLRGKVVQFAKAGLADAPHPYGPANRPPSHWRGQPGTWPGEMDCSLFTALCFMWAGANDPGGSNYSGANSNTMESYQMSRGTRVSLGNAQAGDLVIFNDHVEILVDCDGTASGSHVISMGSANGPHFYTLAGEAASHTDSARIYSPLT